MLRQKTVRDVPVREPFAGEVANLAMPDGAERGLALTAHPAAHPPGRARGRPSARPRPAAQEEKLVPRGAAAGSPHGGAALFTEDAPQAVVDLFTARP